MGDLALLDCNNRCPWRAATTNVVRNSARQCSGVLLCAHISRSTENAALGEYRASTRARSCGIVCNDVPGPVLCCKHSESYLKNETVGGAAFSGCRHTLLRIPVRSDRSFGTFSIDVEVSLSGLRLERYAADATASRRRLERLLMAVCGRSRFP